MTVSSTERDHYYTATDGQTVFPYNFKVREASDLGVWKNGSKLTLTTDYSVSNVGDASGGNVTLTSGAAADDEIAIVRQSTPLQENDYSLYSNYPVEALEEGVDDAIMAAQDAQGTADRSLRLPDHDSTAGTDMTIPAKDDRLGKYLSFDDSGLPKAVDPPLVGENADISVSDVTNLRAADVSDLSGNETAILLGYNDPGDGGGGTLYWGASSTETDNGGTIFKPDSIDAADPGRWKRRLEGYVTPEMFGATGSGDETAIIQAASDAVDGNTFIFDGAKTYSVTSITLPANASVLTNGCLFEFAGGSQGNVSIVETGNNSFVDSIRISIPTGEVVERVLNHNSDKSHVMYAEVISVDQQSNGSEPLDGAIQVRGSRSSLLQAYVKNCDKPYVISGASHCEIGPWEAESYVRGIYQTGSDNIKSRGSHLHTASPNASFTAGHNGWLVNTSNDCEYFSPIVEDAGEHGFRIAGGGDSVGLTWNSPKAKNVGGCGFKSRPDFGDLVYDLRIINPIMVDCGSNGPNQEGLLIERARRIAIINPLVYKENKAVSSTRGIKTFDVQHIRILGGELADTGNQAIFMQSTDGSGNSADIDEVSVIGTRLLSPGSGAGDAIRIDYRGGALGNLDIDVYVSDPNDHVFDFDDGGTGTIATLCFINARVNGEGAGLVTGSGYDQSKILTKFHDLEYDGFVGSDGSTGNNLPPTWSASKTSTGTYKITHNLDISNTSFMPQFVARGNKVYPSILAQNTNTVDVVFENVSGTAVDTDFYFTARVPNRLLY